jgi:hypothetical protein
MLAAFRDLIAREPKLPSQHRLAMSIDPVNLVG